MDRHEELKGGWDGSQCTCMLCAAGYPRCQATLKANPFCDICNARHVPVPPPAEYKDRTVYAAMAFEEAIDAVCRQYGVSISHEDEHGSFIILASEDGGLYGDVRYKDLPCLKEESRPDIDGPMFDNYNTTDAFLENMKWVETHRAGFKGYWLAVDIPNDLVIACKKLGTLVEIAEHHMTKNALCKPLIIKIGA